MRAEAASFERSCSMRAVGALVSSRINGVRMDGKMRAWFEAAEAGNVEMLSRLGPEVEIKNARDEAGQTVLMVVCRLGFPKCVEAVLACGVDLEARNEEGETALLLAAKWCAGRDAVRRLLDAGCDISASDHRGYTALINASGFDNEEAVCELLSRGRDVDESTSTGLTAAGYAVYCGAQRSLAALLAAGAQTHRARLLASKSFRVKTQECLRMLDSEDASRERGDLDKAANFGRGRGPVQRM